MTGERITAPVRNERLATVALAISPWHAPGSRGHTRAKLQSDRILSNPGAVAAVVAHAVDTDPQAVLDALAEAGVLKDPDLFG